MKLTAKFEEPVFLNTIASILNLCKRAKIAAGIHVVQADATLLQQRVDQGYQFLAYSIDSVFLNQVSQNPAKR
jgi:2-dehydro-3-deoxyglucarate aldolase